MAVRILLLEDQGLVRAGMEALLRAVFVQAEIHALATAEQAMDCMNRLEFDFAFLDIDLQSNLSGMDVLSRLRQTQQGCRVVMLSGVDDRQTVLASIDAGASGFIPKSTEDAAIFQRALEVVLDDGIFLPASVMELGRPMGKSMGEATGGSLPALSDRQREVLYYLCQGMPNKSIANAMGISEGTVRKSYVSELLRLFGVTRRTELIIEIARRKIRVPRPGGLIVGKY